MRGDDNQQEGMFSDISPEKRIPADHPLRPIRKMVDEILKQMSPKFQKLYFEWGVRRLLAEVSGWSAAAVGQSRPVVIASGNMVR